MLQTKLLTMMSSVQVPPLPPTNVTVTNVTTTSVALTWVPGPTGGYQQTFSVMYRQEQVASYQSPDVEILHIDNGMLTATVEALSPSTKYEFVVVAHNEYGQTRGPAVVAETTGSWYLTIMYELHMDRQV